MTIADLRLTGLAGGTVEGGWAEELTPADNIIRWGENTESLFVATALTARRWSIVRLMPLDGRRQPVVTLGPSDAAGVTAVSVPLVSADGRTYAYRYNQALSDLFIADNIR